MTSPLSQSTLNVCHALLDEYAANGNSFDSIIFKDIPHSRTPQLQLVLTAAETTPEKIDVKDLFELSRLFTTIGAYTTPFQQTKIRYGQDGIHKAADEFAAFVTECTAGREPK